MEELISIIIPVYNAQNYIEETLKSIFAQTFGNYEILLIDDVSTDNTGEVISKYISDKVIYYRMEDNLGAYAARNKGLELSKGRYIAFLDADDLWEPEKLSHEMEFMKKKDAGFVFTGYEFADANGVGNGRVVKVPPVLKYKDALHNTTIFTSTVLIDRTKVSNDLIRMPAVKSEDTATWWNILRNGHDAYGLNENLVRYRRAGKSLSSNKFEAIKRIWNLQRNVAGLSIPCSIYHFCLWAVLAVFRRI